MKLQTKFQEEIEMHENDVVTFENGIPGFEDEKKFIVLPLEDSPFSILQSVTTKELAFVMADPFSFFKDYEFTLPDSVIEQLDIHSEEDLFIQVIITLGETLHQSTANLQAPVIMNKRNNKGKQVVLNDANYTTRHPIKMAAPAGQEG
ncbi:flagellar assembly protein FliW [Fictibacillus gelatini]|uniref:flagellar assembly protein FliW n=1 Tax=Fictibacillus gelatini TaxID=225985 RepID=UPI000402E28D|nr:flagellar assembly protein FliW [Fictibacillus gelatini]